MSCVKLHATDCTEFCILFGKEAIDWHRLVPTRVWTQTKFGWGVMLSSVPHLLAQKFTRTDNTQFSFGFLEETRVRSQCKRNCRPEGRDWWSGRYMQADTPSVMGTMFSCSYFPPQAHIYPVVTCTVSKNFMSTFCSVIFLLTFISFPMNRSHCNSLYYMN